MSATLEKRLERIEETALDSDDGGGFNPDDCAFAYVLMNHELSTGVQEEFWSETGKNGEGCVFDFQHLEDYHKGKQIICIFDVTRCDKTKFLNALHASWFQSHAKGVKFLGFLPQTDPNTPERAAEVAQFVAAAIPQATEETLYLWRDGEIVPGYFLARWQAAQGSKVESV